MFSIRKCVWVGLFLAAAELFPSAAAQAQGSGTGIAGIVVSKQSGQAVADAAIAVEGGIPELLCGWWTEPELSENNP